VRRSLLATHVVALAIWLGALLFSFANAKVLFDAARPICTVCWKDVTAASTDLASCATCGAILHAGCAAKGCNLEHPGAHECRTPVVLDLAPASSASLGGTPLTGTSLTGTSTWTRVRLREGPVSAERRLLWRLDGTAGAITKEQGGFVGAVVEVPRPAVGDALGRSFALAQVIGCAMGLVALGSVFLTPPGGALRFLRLVAVTGALALAGYSLSLGSELATKRLLLEEPGGATPEVRADFGKSHGISSALALGETLLVLVALALATTRRDDAPPKPAA
jgi:hypothetical protein